MLLIEQSTKAVEPADTGQQGTVYICTHRHDMNNGPFLGIRAYASTQYSKDHDDSRHDVDMLA